MSRRSWLDGLRLIAARAHAQASMRRFFRSVKNADAVQRAWLADFVDHGHGEFGRRLGVERAGSYEEFVRRVPIHRYADLAPWIDRVRQGDVGALFLPGQKILMFALTSGTTAEPKYIPITPVVLHQWRSGWSVWGLRALMDHDGCFLRDIVQVASPMRDHDSPCGVPCGAITGLLAATQKKLVRRYYTAPVDVAGIGDAPSRYYTIMRLSIVRDVAFLVTANPATLLLLARTADEQRERIIRDIHDGTLAADLSVEGDVRAAVAPYLTRQPDAARRLERLASQHGGLFPKDYWRLGFIAHWTGGTMGLYRPQFPKYFGEAPVRDIGLLASEGRISIPIADGTASGVLAVRSQFYEFIPASEYGSERPRTLRIHEVEAGQEYFLVLTNGSGLYRYDLGDRVRVTGRLGQAPLIEFLSRDAHTSSLAGEKLTENQVVLAMQQVGSALGETIVDFVLAPVWGEPPGYRLYIEIGEPQADLGRRLDDALGRINLEYESRRKTGRLACVSVVQLPAGFLADRDRRIRHARARTAEQFKHQYLLSQPGMDSELERNAESGGVSGSISSLGAA